MGTSRLFIILSVEVEMLLDDLAIDFDPDGNTAEIGAIGLKPFKRLEDGTWVRGCFSPLFSYENFTSCDNPSDKKEFIKELLSSDCDIPSRERAALKALL